MTKRLIIAVVLATVLTSQLSVAAPAKLKRIAVAQREKLSNEWYVEQYGAQGDGKSVNTKMIQEAVDKCHEAGGGIVTLRSGIYLSGTIQLKDNVTLQVRRGAVLRGTLDPMEYYNIDPFVDATGQSRGECLVGAVDAKNVAIIGNGIIDGEGEYFKAPLTKKRLEGWGRTAEEVNKYFRVRPFLVRIVRCEGVNIKDINLRNPGAWTCHLFESRKIKVEDISIVAHVNINNDGIDLDSCSDVFITGCDIDTGDDAMCIKSTSPKPCENVVITKCRLKSDWGAIKMGTESMGDYRNIKISNCEVYDTKGGGIKILTVDGSNIYNVKISQINMTNVEMPIFVRLGERLRTYRNAPKGKAGSIDELYFAGIKATTRSSEESRVATPSGIFVTGTPNARIGHVSFQYINITLPGGGTKEDAKRIIPEYETRYPEFSHFGVQPAFGLHARHVERLDVKGVTFNLLGTDERPVYKYDDVTYYELEFPFLEKQPE
ncbi:MAG: glycosyl hydrolase family 28 protein [Rikenellaceae bacterium]